MEQIKFICKIVFSILLFAAICCLACLWKIGEAVSYLLIVWFLVMLRIFMPKLPKQPLKNASE